MPELPEVETIRRQLETELVGEKITEVEVRRPKSWQGETGAIIGRRISEVGRVGKYLFFHTDKAVGLIGHLKMTGRMIVKNAESYALALHTRVVMRFESGKRLFFWDTRVFGYLKICADSRMVETILKKKLGPDPWNLDKSTFYLLCQKYARPIKSVILDQELLSGVGNIYANDALWKSGIDPRRSAKTLTPREGQRLMMSLRKVMERGLATGGASDNSYVNAYNEKGKYQDEFLVYRRTNEPCRKCKTKLRRIVVGGRGTWVCERCQS